MTAGRPGHHDDRVVAARLVDIDERRAGRCLRGLGDTRRIPSVSQVLIASSPKASLPIREMKVTPAPARAAATAWFDPLPPGPIANPEPAIVSPIAGRLPARKARSTTKTPRTATPFLLMVIALRPAR